MTFRAGRSYVRFPDNVKTVPASDLEIASARMDSLISDDKTKHHLSDDPPVTKSQNAFDRLDDESEGD